MSNAVKKRVPIVIQGGAAYAANGLFTIDLSSIQEVASQPGGVSYLQGILFTADMVYGNASGGDVTIGGYHVFDAVEQLLIQIPGMDPLLDLPTRAGSALHRLRYATTGRRPIQGNNGGSLLVANGGTTTVRQNLLYMFENERGCNPGDCWIPLQHLREGAQVVGQWANGASGGMLATSVTINSGTLKATALLIEIPEYRVPTWRHVKQIDQPGADNQVMGLAGRVVHALIEIPTQAAAQVADTSLTTANRTQTDLEFDGRKLIERLPTDDLVIMWDEEYVKDAADRFEQEGNAMPFVPHLLPTNVQPGYKITQIPFSRGNPVLRVQGTTTTPRLLVIQSDLNTSMGVLKSVRDSGIPLPSGFSPGSIDQYMRPKTASGYPASRGSNAASRVPVKLHPEGGANA